MRLTRQFHNRSLREQAMAPIPHRSAEGANHLYARARALLARQWSARCYGVARQREGSRQSIRGAALTLKIPLTRARGRGWPGGGRPVATGSLANARGRAKTALGVH